MASYFKVVRGLTRNVHLYNLSWVFIGFAIFGVAGVLANLYMLRLGYSPALIGQIQGVGQLVWAAGALPASLLGIRFGMRNVMVAGTLIVGLAYILFLLCAYFPSASQVPMSFVSFGLIYLGASLSIVCGLPYLSSVTQPEERSTAMALNGAMATGAGVLGNLAAGLLPGWMAALTSTSTDGALPYRLSLTFVPLFMLAAAAVQSRMQADHLPKAETRIGDSKAVPFGIFLFLGVVVFLQAAGEGGMRAFFNIYMDHDLGVSTAALGGIFGISSLASVLGAIVMPPLVARLGSKAAFAVTCIAAALLLTAMGGFPSVPIAATTFISLGLIFSIGGSVRNVLSQEIVQPYWRSATSGILVLGYSLGWAVNALVGGLVINSFHYAGLMYVSAGVSILSSVLMFAYMGFARRKVAAEVAPTS